MWMAHTNFSITDEILNSIEEVPGVEVLQPMTRYRFIIGIGELFDIREVRTMIEEMLGCNKNFDLVINDDKVLKEVYDLKNQLSTFNRWAIYVFPNGNIDFATSDEADFGQQLNMYKQAVDHSNGVLIESDHE
jgi:hypothetical protein